MLDPNLEEEQRTFEMTRAIATAALRPLQQIAPDMRTPLPLFSKLRSRVPARRCRPAAI